MPRAVALLSLALGLAIAVTANVAYAIPRGPVVIGVGLVAPLVLPVVLYLRTVFDVDGWRQWMSREAATLAVAGPAVAVSYWHTFALVLGAGEPLVLALLVPLSSDGLAGMATLALHRLRTAPVAAPVRTVADAAHHLTAHTAPAGQPPAPGGNTDLPAVSPPPTPPAPPRTTPPDHTTPHGDDLLREAVVWAREEAGDDGDTPGWRRIVREFPDLSEHRAKNAAREARTTHPGYLRSVQ